MCADNWTSFLAPTNLSLKIRVLPVINSNFSETISLRDLMKQETKIQEKQENPKIYEISAAFYEGFGYDLLSY